MNKKQTYTSPAIEVVDIVTDGNLADFVIVDGSGDEQLAKPEKPAHPVAVDDTEDAAAEQTPKKPAAYNPWEEWD